MYEIRNLTNDLKYVNTILNRQNQDTFNFIYSRTNENLSKLFNKIDNIHFYSNIIFEHVQGT